MPLCLHNTLTHNASMRQGDDGAEVIAAWKDHLLPKIRAPKPELIIISAGFGANANDPLAGLELQADTSKTSGSL